MKSLGKFFSWFIFVCFSCCTYLLNSNPQVQKSYPYLTTDRFPHNWAIADMVKGYIAGTRKEHHRQAREDKQEQNEATTNMKSKKHT